MMHLPKKLFYAFEAVLYIAYNGSATPVSGKDIAERQGLPPRYLEQMLQKLVRGGILRGVRGPHGGYLLAREKRRITLEDISKVLGEEEAIPTSTPLGDQCIAPTFRNLHTALLDEMRKVTLMDLFEQASTQHIRKTSDERTDFAI